MVVRMSYTHSENEAILELRRRMGDDINPKLYEDTHMFYRFLKARDFNLDQAEEMLRKHVIAREKFQLDSVLKDFDPPEALVKYFPGGVIGFSKEGIPVKYFDVGNMDPKGVRKAAKFPDILRYCIYITEKEMAILEKQSKKFSRPITASIYICDFKNFSFAVASDKKTIEHMIYLSKMYQDNYPERLHRVYMINVSSYFAFTFNILKNFLAAAVINKLQFCAGESYKEELLKVVDADELPAFLGGNKTDPDGDPMCKTFVNHAGKIPEKYFINKSKSNLSEAEGVKKLIIPRSSFSEIELDVENPGSLIEWEFETKTRDIAFGLFYKEVIGDEERMVELVPLMRLDTEDFSEAGVHKCEKAGTYIVLFDNSYSWLRSKEVIYRAEVSCPKALDKEEQD